MPALRVSWAWANSAPHRVIKRQHRPLVEVLASGRCAAADALSLRHLEALLAVPAVFADHAAVHLRGC